MLEVQRTSSSNEYNLSNSNSNIETPSEHTFPQHLRLQQPSARAPTGSLLAGLSTTKSTSSSHSPIISVKVPSMAPETTNAENEDANMSVEEEEGADGNSSNTHASPGGSQEQLNGIDASNGRGSHASSNNTVGNASTLPPPTRESVLQRLSEALLRRSLAKIDLSQKGLTSKDARLVKMALLQNRQLRVLKLGYNQLGDAGLQTLVTGISQHSQLQSLDLGFNNIGDAGCQSLCQALLAPNGVSQLSTLYLAGNCIGKLGAVALGEVIRQPGCHLRRLYMTGNRLFAEGVEAITTAVIEESCDTNGVGIAGSTNGAITNISESQPMDTSSATSVTTGQLPTQSPAKSTSIGASTTGMQELFLGGTALGPAGCQAVARLLASPDCHLKVLSLANCEISDQELIKPDFGLAACIKQNRDNLCLRSLQLSFNKMTHKGLEALMNSLWGSSTLQELRIDNNDIGDRGAQQLAAILPYLKTLETIDVGFNNITNKHQGMKILMKAVAEISSLKALSLSGNPMQDVSSAKAVAYALAYNTSLESLLLVHCQLTTEGQRHVAAGAVSNSRTLLRELAGFSIGPVIVTLGFPDALEHWTNEQVLNFIHLMWNKPTPENANETKESSGFDPLRFLPGASAAKSDPKNQRRSGPLEATIVVDVAKKAFAELVANGVDVFSRRPGHPNATGSPAVFAPRDAIMLESVDGDSIVETMRDIVVSSSPSTSNDDLLGLGIITGPFNGVAVQSPPRNSLSMSASDKTSNQARSFVAPPQERRNAKQNQLPDPSRKKRIVEWLCNNIKHLNQMGQTPFDSGELLRLHQHYFTPVVNESGGASGFKREDNPGSRAVSSVPNVARDSSNNHHYNDASSPSLASSTTMQSSDVSMVPASDPALVGVQQHQQPQPRNGDQQQAVVSSLPMLKRKVSYRFLGDASLHLHSSQLSHQQPQPPMSRWGSSSGAGNQMSSVSRMIQDGPSGHSLPPKNKKARRNRTRISFLPRIKAKLDSYLDVCHEKALVTMRQLYYVEQAILSGRVNPIEEGSPRTHLSGALATDAETIVVDMI